MNRHGLGRRSDVFALLFEGMSIRATVRITGVSKPTILKWIVEYGTAAERFLDDVMQDLPCVRIQVDEMWGFCYARKQNVPPEHAGELGYGELWTWLAICPDTKAIVTWCLGLRDLHTGRAFLKDLAGRFNHPIQLSSDGLNLYPQAVAEAFPGGRVHFGQVVKDFAKKKALRYDVVSGNPNHRHISTSLIESFNLVLRMHQRRYTRLTNAHSKKLENHAAMAALFLLFYNFARPHDSLRGCAPAQALGLTRRLWTMGDMLAMLEDSGGQI